MICVQHLFVLLLLLLLAVILPRLCVAQSTCRTAPMWLFANPADIRHLINNIQDELVLVSDGSPNRVLAIREFAIQTVIVFVEVEEVPLIWCIQGSKFQEIKYSFNIVSDDPMIVADPDITVPLQGDITTTPYRFRLIFRCKASSSSSIVGMTASINLTSSQGEEFCPILFYFSKDCSANDGFLDDFQFSFKTLTTPTIIIPNAVPVILKGVLIPLSIIILVICISSIIAAWLIWWRSRHKICDIECVGEAYRQVHKIRSGGYENEFPSKKLMISWELGKGAFGVVLKAEAQGIVDGEEFSCVAVKQLHPGSNETEDFFREVNFMSSLDHPNIVRLLGVCSKEEPFSMIFEYMDLGDLCSFLREAVGLGADIDDREEEEEEVQPLLTQKELLHIVQQVAEGMVYISSKRLVHRDLATRNCLVSMGLVIKIADFGLSRNLEISDYYRLKGPAMLPIRWMPPESLLYGKFTVESDIWAFGVLMWEVFTFGQRPFSGLDNEEVITEIKEGRFLEAPPKCPVKQLMLKCWTLNPRRRPRFEESLRDIGELFDEEQQ